MSATPHEDARPLTLHANRYIKPSAPGVCECVVPTHCVKGHEAMWCDCAKFVAAPNGRFTHYSMIRYPAPSHCGQCGHPWNPAHR